MSDRFAAKALDPNDDTLRVAKPNSCVENMTPFVLMIALGVHATFEGIAVGIESNLGDA